MFDEQIHLLFLWSEIKEEKTRVFIKNKTRAQLFERTFALTGG